MSYTLKDCYPGYIYIGLMGDYIEANDMDRWEGEINDGETKIVLFTVKLKRVIKKYG